MPVTFHVMAGFFRFARGVAIVAIVVGMFVVSTPATADAVGGEGESWPSFNESNGCGSVWMRGPNVEDSGALPGSTVLRGPHADYFGRTVSEVWNSLTSWAVPMSSGKSVQMHSRVIPALTQTASNLFDAAAKGYWYRVVDRYTFGYTARTMGHTHRISQHTLGNAIDMNSTTNPSTNGSLITDMPPWFVTAWSDAGFCWGGDWLHSKDAMHFNWRGPNFTPGFTDLPASYAPLTSREDFARLMHTSTVPGALADTRFRLLMDADGDGAIDVVNVSDVGSGTIIDVLQARTGYQACSVVRYVTPGRITGTVAIPGDWDRDGAQDLWVIDDSAGLSVTAYLQFGDFTETETVTVPSEPGDAYLAADHNVDGWSDLYILRHDGSIWTVEVRSGADRFVTVLATGSFPGEASARFTALDRDLDHVPDLAGVTAGGSFIVDGSSGFTTVELTPGVEGAFYDIAGTDFDGDGRHDLAVLFGDSLRVYAGNSALPGLAVTSWFELPEYECASLGLPYPYEGSFRDDERSVHRYDIERIAAFGVTRGCNPPLNDRFCPGRSITRGELAAFLSRALNLPGSDTDTYVDDDESIFEGDIESLVGAGVLVSCNAAGDRFCPDELVTRELMARFLVAAFGFEIAAEGTFIDIEGSLYEDDINTILVLGVTKGCNPPINDMFCPQRVVPRQEMASFMIRALLASSP